MELRMIKKTISFQAPKSMNIFLKPFNYNYYNQKKFQINNSMNQVGNWFVFQYFLIKYCTNTKHVLLQICICLM